MNNKKSTKTNVIYDGQVKVEKVGQSYRVRFTHEGLRYCFGTGIKVCDAVSERAAIAKAKEVEADIYSGRFNGDCDKYKPEKRKKPPRNLHTLFSEFMLAKQQEIRPNTYEKKYLQSEKDIRSVFERHGSSMDDFNLNTCKTILNEWKKIWSYGTIKNKCNILMGFWDWMQAEEDVIRNPWRKALATLKIDEIRKPDIFTDEERKKILATVATDEFKRWQPLVTFLMLTGCRPSEAFALTFGDIDLEKGVISINKGYTVEINKTKTGKSRTIPVNVSLRACIENAVQNREINDDTLCFPHPNIGGYCTNNSYWQLWKRLLKVAGVPYRKPYTNRHTFITEALVQGGNPLEVAAIAGNSPDVIYKHYANLQSDVRRSMPTL